MAVGLLGPAKSSVPILLWNASQSVPIGLYTTTRQAPVKGKLAVIQLPKAASELANARGYLPAGALMIKPVAATSGDIVCRHGLLVRINTRLRAAASPRDRWHRPLPRWRGCRYLTKSELFVLSTAGRSFDGRYFGPITQETVLGTAVPIWSR